MKPFALAAIVLCGAAQAQELPALFDVTGVAVNDVLNVRSQPSAAGQILTGLAPDATHIEVTARDGNWGRVNTGEQAGWVSMSYLTEQIDSTIGHAYRYQCFGTEPFWSLDATAGNRAVISWPDQQDVTYLMGNIHAASGRPWPHAVVGSTPEGAASMTLIMSPRDCSDGMSDQMYGLEAALMLNSDDPRFFSGCCTLDID
ncbi:MAG: SH3 domain-containing protein [Pelagimonas sp.]|jgi:uncharacterized membrane protein|nr:SH3 domain-containing protein [Pelagimonas sp.]